jgi:tetratricopeptide (TPR) repeat protein
MKIGSTWSKWVGRTCLSTILGGVLLATLMVQPVRALPQPKPVQRSRVMALLVHRDANSYIRRLVELQGIAFTPTPADLQAFREVGASEILLKALQHSKFVPAPDTATSENPVVFRHLADGVAKAHLCAQESDSQKRAGSCDEAEHELRAAVAADPRSASAHYALGALLAMLKVSPRSSAEPLPELREAVRLEADFAEAHEALGDALEEAHDEDGAVAELREAIDLRPDLDLPSAPGVLVGILVGQKGTAGAIEAIKGDVRREPKNAAYHFELAWLYRESGNLDGVIAECSEAVLLNPDDEIYHFVLAQALLYGKGDAAGAIPHYREAMRLEQESGTISIAPGMYRYNLGIALVANKSYDEALVELRETRRVAQIPGATVYIAEALLGKGDAKGAIEELRSYIADYPQDPGPRALLAIAYARLSQMTEAIKECSEARKVAQRDEAKKEVGAVCDAIEDRAKKPM